MFGHKDQQCRKKPGLRQEWRPVQKKLDDLQNKGDFSQDNINAASMDHIEDGFVTVRRRAAATSIGQPDLTTPICNSYQVLAPECQDQENRTEQDSIPPHG